MSNPYHHSVEKDYFMIFDKENIHQKSEIYFNIQCLHFLYLITITSQAMAPSHHLNQYWLSIARVKKCYELSLCLLEAVLFAEWKQ